MCEYDGCDNFKPLNESLNKAKTEWLEQKIMLDFFPKNH